MLQRRYPSSLMRIISNYKLLHESGLLDFFDAYSAWRHKCVRGGGRGAGMHDGPVLHSEEYGSLRPIRGNSVFLSATV